ncbi:MAG: hypothetical protein MJ126_04530 [Lachnospiraceae bacterium]|nr:hypothetical protein [Lachnospiraceae bacterium]
MNEVKDAECIINEETNNYTPGVAIGVLAKYYIKKKNMNSTDAKTEIKSVLVSNWPCINLYEWDERIDKAIKSAKKFPLKEVDEIPITQNELNVINTIPVKRQQRLAFALLVIAKFNYIVSGHEWVNNSIDEINKIAGIKWNNIKSKYNDIHELYLKKLIIFSKKPDNISMKVLYVDKESTSNTVINIKAFDNVGKVWSKFNNINYKFCIDCGTPFKVSGKSRGRKVRCDDCQQRYRLKYKAKKEKEYRNS